jgi:Tol biopolymer transport system component
MRGLRWGALVVAAGGLLAGCLPPEPAPPPPPPVVTEAPTPLPPPSPPPAPPPPGRTDQIVYVGAGGIWTMHPDATGVHQLTDDDGFQPEVSRDGQKIAYVRSFPTVSNPGLISYTHIWVMNADGSDQHEVFVAPPISAPCGAICIPPYQQAPDTIRDQSPSWSPDGTEIAFIRHPVNLVDGGVLVMNSDGTGVTRLIVRDPNDEDRFVDDAWSPDGATIAASHDYICGSQHIQMYAANGSGATGELLGLRNCGDNTTNDDNPNWSADSTRIAFNGVPNLDGMMDNGPIGVNGTWLANLSRPPDPILLAPASPFPAPSSNPSYSPDGTRIAFGRNGTIWTMKAIPGFEGSDQDDTHVAGSDPSWGP